MFSFVRETMGPVFTDSTMVLSFESMYYCSAWSTVFLLALAVW